MQSTNPKMEATIIKGVCAQVSQMNMPSFHELNKLLEGFGYEVKPKVQDTEDLKMFRWWESLTEYQKGEMMSYSLGTVNREALRISDLRRIYDEHTELPVG